MRHVRVAFFALCIVAAQAPPASADPYGNLNGAFELASTESLPERLRFPGTLAGQKLDPLWINSIEVNSLHVAPPQTSRLTPRPGRTPSQMAGTARPPAGESPRLAARTGQAVAGNSIGADGQRKGLMRLIRSPRSGAWLSISDAGGSADSGWKIVRRPGS